MLSTLTQEQQSTLEYIKGEKRREQVLQSLIRNMRPQVLSEYDTSGRKDTLAYIPTIEKDTKLSRRTVHLKIWELENKGIVTSEWVTIDGPHWNPGPKHFKMYKLTGDYDWLKDVYSSNVG